MARSKKSGADSSSPKRALETICGEISTTVSKVAERDITALADAVAGAKRVFTSGAGRSGFVARCFTQRLVHLGLKAHVIGETTTPSCGEGDLLVAVSGSGERPASLLRVTEAASAGCDIAAVTWTEDSVMSRLARTCVLLPRIASEQFGGSLFEQSALIVLDSVVMLLAARLGVDHSQMYDRHANVE